MIKKYKTHTAFTMIELIFVIVVMGIIGKFGVEFIAQAYRGFISSSINNKLQTDTSTALEFVATRLQYRIKASTIARETNAAITPQFTLLSDYFNATAPIIEWIGADIDGFRGTTAPIWSGVIDLNASVSSNAGLFSLATNTAQVNTLISTLSNAAAVQNDMAIYFVNPDALPSADGWGWDANTTVFDNQNTLVNGSPLNIHPVKSSAGNANIFIPMRSDGVTNSFAGVTAYEYYQLAWSAYAIGINNWNAATSTGTLTLWYDYQPWKGERYTDNTTKSSTIMDNVSSFRFIASGSIVKVQICVKSTIVDGDNDTGGYSLCKEKTIF